MATAWRERANNSPRSGALVSDCCCSLMQVVLDAPSASGTLMAGERAFRARSDCWRCCGPLDTGSPGSGFATLVWVVELVVTLVIALVRLVYEFPGVLRDRLRIRQVVELPDACSTAQAAGLRGPGV
jgi:hypothetical protein